MRLPVLYFLFPLALSNAGVRVEDVPERGVQPQVAVDAAGEVHLVYLTGKANGGDVRYVHRKNGASSWSEPVTVNTTRGTAVAMGTIRGAQISVGKGGAVHVLWNGAMIPGASGGAPLYYASLASGGGSFAPQRNLLGDTGALDGGASIAADADGNVFVAWHGKAPGAEKGEAGRMVFVARSKDGGATFATPVAGNADFMGTCACCSMKALAPGQGKFVAFYRSAHSPTDRDLQLLTSADSGASFSRTTVDHWKTATCPMSSAALLATPKGIRAAWETEGKIRTSLTEGGIAPVDVATSNAKHPALAINAKGETLVVWTIGTGWNRGGDVGWAILDNSGRISAERGKTSGVPVWSHAAAYAEPSGTFVVLR